MNFKKKSFKNKRRRILSLLPGRIRKVDGVDYSIYYNYHPDVNTANRETKIIENVFLHVPTGTLYKKGNGLLSISKIGKSQIKRSGLIGAKLPSIEKIKIVKVGSSFYCNSANNGFYHWLIECMPRYYFIDENVKCYLPKLSELNREILNTIYGKRLNINQVDDQWLFFEKFYLAKYFALPGKGLVPKEFHTHILDILPQFKTNSLLIYISRIKAPKRRLINECELIDKVLKKYSINILYLEDFKFKQQLEFIKQAKIIIAPHGAGLSNLIAATSNCKILEIIPSDKRPLNFYKALSKSLNLDYTNYLISEPVGRYADFKLSNVDFNFIENFIIKNID